MLNLKECFYRMLDCLSKESSIIPIFRVLLLSSHNFVWRVQNPSNLNERSSIHSLAFSTHLVSGTKIYFVSRVQHPSALQYAASARSLCFNIDLSSRSSNHSVYSSVYLVSRINNPSSRNGVKYILSPESSIHLLFRILHLNGILTAFRIQHPFCLQG